ncbi:MULTISPECIES: hypothetical protein [Actinosynnema]|uniref:hypothetical protein n=1 Tax=Actinosynnema TaxID=40566 RepID=UPI0020A2E8DD|nr:hypothetical protein [Actinosynnema pretiosum]MCP2095589.1 hypothetical protein [Actinosynnema pretiosum]
MTDPLVNAQRSVDDWERDAEEKAARYESTRQEVERISITASATNGAVSVTALRHRRVASRVMTATSPTRATCGEAVTGESARFDGVNT